MRCPATAHSSPPTPTANSCSARPAAPLSIWPDATTWRTMPARSRATSPARQHSRTPCRWTSPWAARPTRCCICWPPRRKAKSTFSMSDIDRLSRRVPNLCKVAPVEPLSPRGRASRRRCHGDPRVSWIARSCSIPRCPLFTPSRSPTLCATWDVMRTEDPAVQEFFRAGRPASPPRRLLAAVPLFRAGYGSRPRLHPHFRVRLQQGRWARRALRQPRRAGLHRQDRGC